MRKSVDEINRILERRYVPAENEEDPGWYRCLDCNMKVYLGDDNASDFLRHERQYHSDE